MLPSRTANNAVKTRDKMFLVLIATLVVAQLIAFWMLCSHQVSQAQARGATVQVRGAAGSQRHDPKALMEASENTANLSASAARPTSASFRMR